MAPFSMPAATVLRVQPRARAEVSQRVRACAVKTMRSFGAAGNSPPAPRRAVEAATPIPHRAGPDQVGPVHPRAFGSGSSRSRRRHKARTLVGRLSAQRDRREPMGVIRPATPGASTTPAIGDSPCTAVLAALSPARPGEAASCAPRAGDAGQRSRRRMAPGGRALRRRRLTVAPARAYNGAPRAEGWPSG
jgi:hypothetical protein